MKLLGTLRYTLGIMFCYLACWQCDGLGGDGYCKFCCADISCYELELSRRILQLHCRMQWCSCWFIAAWAIPIAELPQTNNDMPFLSLQNSDCGVQVCKLWIISPVIFISMYVCMYVLFFFCRVSICTVNCKHKVVRQIAMKLGMRDVGEDDCWNLYWADISLSLNRAKGLKRFQVIMIIFCAV